MIILPTPVECTTRRPRYTSVLPGHFQPQRAQRQMTLPNMFRPIESNRTAQCFTGRLPCRESVIKVSVRKSRFCPVELIIALMFVGFSLPEGSTPSPLRQHLF